MVQGPAHGRRQKSAGRPPGACHGEDEAEAGAGRLDNAEARRIIVDILFYSRKSANERNLHKAICVDYRVDGVVRIGLDATCLDHDACNGR